MKGWLTRAVMAPRGPQWICDNCHHVHSQWTPVCDNCEAFDTLSWRKAPAGEYTSPMSTEMLPMIVGKIEEPPADPEPAPAPTLPQADPDVADAEVLPPTVEPEEDTAKKADK